MQITHICSEIRGSGGNKGTDVIQQPDLFKINNVTHDEQLLNLCLLLLGHNPLSDYVTLPSSSDASTMSP